MVDPEVLKQFELFRFEVSPRLRRLAARAGDLN